MINKNKILTILGAAVILIACGATTATVDNSVVSSPEYSLKLGDSSITVDSVSTLLWYNDELKKDIITCQVYCTSGYPITDEFILKDNKITCINIQAVAETGKHVIQHENDDWINLINYQFSNTTSLLGHDPEGKKHWININSIDKEKGLVSIELHAEEYISLKQRMEKKTETREVVFVGNNIPFRKSK